MEFLDFISIVDGVRKKKPILFGLDSDNVVSDDKIKKIENYYCIQLPESYKVFLKKYGGGYFAYTVIYSGDVKSNFYVIKNISKEWVDKYDFFPVMDFETGDLGGFEIDNKKCCDYFSIFVHEEKKIIKYQYDLFQALLKYGLKLK